MKRIFLLIILLAALATQASVAQSKFGTATIDELNMTSYAQDTSANAVILLKEGNTQFVYNDESGFQYQYTLMVKIKILSTEGLRWCDNEIGYYEVSRTSKERISHLSGTTYNLEEDKIVKTKLSKEFIFDENIDEKRKIRKFTLPAAKVGSVIEFKYTIISDFYWDLPDFYFQASVPTLKSKYEVTIPEYFMYNVNMRGYETIVTASDQVTERFNIRYKDDAGRMQSTTHTCTASKRTMEGSDIPAMKDEGYVWAQEDYIAKVGFELSSTRFPGSMYKSYTSTWNVLDKELFESKSFGDYLKKSGMFKNDIEKKETTIENASEILKMVKYKVKWNDRNSFYPDNLGDVMKKGLGTSSDMNFVLINALNAGGFDAYPVLLSTRGNGRLPVANPSLSALNYVVAALQIDTMTYYADAASKYGDWNILPMKTMVSEARLLNKTSGSWVDLSKTSSGTISISAEYKFETDGLKNRVRQIMKGQDALLFKESYHSYKDEAEYIEKFASRTALEIKDFEVSGVEEAGVDVKTLFTAVNPNIVLGGEYLYINPIFGKHFSDNPFKREERLYPVQFNYLSNYRQAISIYIPEGYAVEELPKSERFLFGDNSISCVYRISQNENMIVLSYNFQINELLFLPEDYPSLRDFFAKLIAKTSEQIVLKKNN